MVLATTFVHTDVFRSVQMWREF